jgi:hypothetical protein
LRRYSSTAHALLLPIVVPPTPHPANGPLSQGSSSAPGWGEAVLPGQEEFGDLVPVRKLLVHPVELSTELREEAPLELVPLIVRHP